MKILYELETPWPEDVKNPEGFESLTWSKHGEIPFLPVAGMHIDSGDGDLREVLEVYWQADEPDRVAVFFEDELARDLCYWRGGWQSEDLPKIPAKSRKA